MAYSISASMELSVPSTICSTMGSTSRRGKSGAVGHGHSLACTFIIAGGPFVTQTFCDRETSVLYPAHAALAMFRHRRSWRIFKALFACHACCFSLSPKGGEGRGEGIGLSDVMPHCARDAERRRSDPNRISQQEVPNGSA